MKINLKQYLIAMSVAWQTFSNEIFYKKFQKVIEVKHVQF